MHLSEMNTDAFSCCKKIVIVRDLKRDAKTSLSTLLLKILGGGGTTRIANDVGTDLRTTFHQPTEQSAKPFHPSTASF